MGAIELGARACGGGARWAICALYVCSLAALLAPAHAAEGGGGVTATGAPDGQSGMHWRQVVGLLSLVVLLLSCNPLAWVAYFVGRDNAALSIEGVRSSQLRGRSETSEATSGIGCIYVPMGRGLDPHGCARQVLCGMQGGRQHLFSGVHAFPGPVLGSNKAIPAALMTVVPEQYWNDAIRVLNKACDDYFQAQDVAALVYERDLMARTFRIPLLQCWALVFHCCCARNLRERHDHFSESWGLKFSNTLGQINNRWKKAGVEAQLHFHPGVEPDSLTGKCCRKLAHDAKSKGTYAECQSSPERDSLDVLDLTDSDTSGDTPAIAGKGGPDNAHVIFGGEGGARSGTRACLLVVLTSFHTHRAAPNLKGSDLSDYTDGERGGTNDKLAGELESLRLGHERGELSGAEHASARKMLLIAAGDPRAADEAAELEP